MRKLHLSFISALLLAATMFGQRAESKGNDYRYLGTFEVRINGRSYADVPEYANLSSITGNRRGRMTITFQARMDGRGSIDHVNIGIVAYCNQGYAVSDQFYVYYLGSTRGVRKTNVSIDDAVANIALSYCR